MPKAPSAEPSLEPNDPLVSLAPRPDAATPDAAPITVLVARKIKKGREREFESALAELQTILEKQPGFQELKAYQPGPPAKEHQIVLSFDNAANLADWQKCAERRAWLERVKPLEEASPRSQVHTGIESWFASPEQEGLAQPPKWKMAVVSWLGIFPIILVVNYTVMPHLKSWPTWASSALTSIILVTLMQTGILPMMTRLTSRFLYPEVKLPPRRK